MIPKPNAPFFVKHYSDNSGGVDYLGIRSVNFAFMDELLPGINNVTTLIRPYSVITWAAWAFREEKRRRSEQEARYDEFKRFREKIEVLFGWGHQIHNTGGGLVGNQQRLPEETTNVSLEFNAWNRSVSWLDAGNYGPSLKNENGLGFLVQKFPNVFAATNAGERLAKALDKSLIKCDHYNELRSLDKMVGTVELADSLYAYWKTKSPSSDEAEAFRAVFYRPEKSRENSRAGRRSAAIALILWALNEQTKPVSTSTLRRYMTLYEIGAAPNCRESEILVRVQGLWRVLQLRQAQRLATETIFGWIEIEILEHSRKLSSEIADDFVTLLEKQWNSGNLPVDWVTHEIKQLERKKGEASSYLVAARGCPSLDFFEHMKLISGALQKDRDQSAVLALKLLVYCAELTRELELSDNCTRYLNEGGASRISLLTWSKFVSRGRDLHIKTFLIDMIENYFLSQHFGVAAARYTEGTQRLRITIEEGGLVSMLTSTKDAWYPTVTSDRLRSALELMADCDMIGRLREEDGVRYEAQMQ